MPADTKREKPEGRILSAAQKRISRLGSEGFTVKGIVQEAETGVGQFLKHFRNTDNLKAVVFAEGWEHVEHEIFPKLLALNRKHADFLVDIVEAALVAFRNHPEAVRAAIVVAWERNWKVADPDEHQGYQQFRYYLESIAKMIDASIDPEEKSVAIELIAGAIGCLLLQRTQIPVELADVSIASSVNLEPLRRMINAVLIKS
jgi:AcrR family transcriptional regulator